MRLEKAESSAAESWDGSVASIKNCIKQEHGNLETYLKGRDVLLKDDLT